MPRFALIGVLLFAALTAGASADTRDDLRAAIQKLADSDSYSWSTADGIMDVWHRSIPLFLPGSTHSYFVRGDYFYNVIGKVQKDGLMMFSVESDYEHSQAAMKAGKIAILAGNEWRSDAAIPQRRDDDRTPPDVTSYAALLARNFMSPVNKAFYFLSKTERLRNGGDLYMGYLSDDATHALLPMPHQPEEGDDNPPLRQPMTRITYHVENGVLTSFDFDLSCLRNTFNFTRGIDVNIEDVNYTAIALPDAAIAQLGLPLIT